MESIAVINQKGGVGKSTTALALGAGLVLRGYKVLFIDLDAQGNLTHTLGGINHGITVMELLQQTSHVQDAIQTVTYGELIASSSALSGADTIVSTTGKEYRLKESLHTLKGRYHYCIIDTPPALGILTVNALTSCTGAIIPAQADIYSLHGISQLYSTVTAVKKYCNQSLVIKGIVLTRYNSRAIISREIAELIEQTATRLNTRLYKTKIRECTAIKESQATGQSIFAYALKSNAAIDYNAFIDEVISEGVEEHGAEKEL